MAYIKSRLIPVAVVSLLAALLLITPPLLGIHDVPVPRSPEPRYELSDFSKALAAGVTENGVSYDKLLADRDHLLHFVEGMATIGPESAPERFLTRPEKLAYYINAYNALVLYGVLVHQPETSVQDVHGIIEPLPGFGFFWAQRFGLDGDRINLYDLENEILRELGDARIHAAINCASISCPALRAKPFHPETLDEELDEQTRAWVAGEAHVQVTPTSIVLSEIFAWFEDDFASHAQDLGVGSTTLDWIAHYLPEEKRTRFVSARARGLEVEHRPYNWGLNRAE